MPTKNLSLIVKRLFDIILSSAGLIFFLPIWPIVTILIYFLEDGRPIYFSDIRIGINRKPYAHFKFRSMIKNAEVSTGPMWSLENDKRVTKFGRILRATAMDELPQLINILKGDMSFVGPRSERQFFVEKFSREIPGYEKRFTIRPGLTGMAQVYGRYDSPPEKKLSLDLEYIKRMNFFLDLKLIFLSFLITFEAGWERFENK